MAKDKDILDDALEAFKAADDHESTNRKNWLDDMRFARLGEQWPEQIKKQREREGRPCLTLNRLPSFIRQVTNDARQNRPQIKIHPVSDGANEETAEILSGLIRNVEYSSNAEVAYDTALDHAVTGGFGYFRISTDYASDDAFDQDIRIERITNPLTVYGDPNSNEADSSDWNTAFITDLISLEQFKKQYKGAEESSFEAGREDRNLTWFQDDKIRIAEYWTRDEVPKTLLKLSNGTVMYEDEYLKLKDIIQVRGITVIGTRPTKSHKVTQRIITGAEVLEENKWAGKYIPIVPVYGDELNIEGERHFLSLVRFAKDPQQMFNFWRTASTELVALQPKAPFIGPRGAFNTDSEKWATANTVSHAYIEYDGAVPPQRQGFAGPPAGALQEALNASDDMKSIMGIYDASLGAKSNETSGKAILARQREGDVSTFNFIDNLSRGIRHAGRIMVDLIPRVYDVPRIARIMHIDGKTTQVQLNQQFPAPQPENMDDADPKELQEFQQGVMKLYDVTTGKYDVTVTAGPSFTTQREEAANQMILFAQSNPNAGPLIGDLIAKNLDWPGADEIAKRMKAMLPPQVLGQNPAVAQLQQQMQMMDGQAKQAVAQLQGELQNAQQALNNKQAEIQVKQAELQIKQAEIQLKQMDAAAHEKELAIKEYEAQTKRLEAVAKADAEQKRIEVDALQATQQVNQPVAEPAQQPASPVTISMNEVNQAADLLSQAAVQMAQPKKKRARAVKGPDGSWLLESVEVQ